MSKINDVLKKARSLDRISIREIIDNIFTNFFELHGDRDFKDDLSIVGGIALLNGTPVTVIGIQKGKNLDENLKTNFGQPTPSGYRKALRLMEQAEKFNRPIITFINTAGAYPGIEAEEHGQGAAIARNLFEMSKLTIPVIAVIIGEGRSGGALALVVANKVLMLENAIYSVISPEGFATILWKDKSKFEEAAKIMRITAGELLEMEVIDCVIKEEHFFDTLKTKLCFYLGELEKLTPEELQKERYQRFRKF